MSNETCSCARRYKRCARCDKPYLSKWKLHEVAVLVLLAFLLVRGGAAWVNDLVHDYEHVMGNDGP